MSTIAIIGCCVTGAILGFGAGLAYGEHVDSGDLPIAPVIYAPFGAALGAIVGTCVGVTLA
jgi:hypothetical protein